MLDYFLEAAYTRTKEAEASLNLASKLEQLPDELLHKLASGEEKLAYHDSGYDGGWLEKFKGTPLFDQALALEKTELEIRQRDMERRKEQGEFWRESDAIRDELSVKRKMLDLELAAAEEGVQQEPEIPEESPEEEVAAVPEVEEEVEEEESEEEELSEDEKEASARMRFAVARMKLAASYPSKEAMAKQALTAAIAKGLIGGAGKAMMGAGKTLGQSAMRTGKAFQRGGLAPAARTAGRSALTFAGKHPGVAAGAAGLGAGLALG